MSPSKPKASKLPKNLTKRHTLAEQDAFAESAFDAVARLYCDVFAFWRECKHKTCKRQRRCLGGNPIRCLQYGLYDVPFRRLKPAMAGVIAGGPRRLPPERHAEWTIRRLPLQDWLGSSPSSRPLAQAIRKVGK